MVEVHIGQHQVSLILKKHNNYLDRVIMIYCLAFFYISNIAKTFDAQTKRNPIPLKVQWINKNENEKTENIRAESQTGNPEEEDHDHSEGNEQKARWVVMLTIAIMILEIGFGYYIGSSGLNLYIRDRIKRALAKSLQVE